ncbi:MAG: hypothetical protein E6626_16705, partial [Flavonifractor plautii]|nr:hypothetical protein [Flavonifractor plautii]MDU6292263.1 hypothetical protein [Flavonifractor plautii]MDU6344722.1 hypothetical protein [Flavonifractor plautii]
MADDKLNAGTKDNTPPEAPAPAGKVIDLSSIQVATDHDGKESTAPDVTAPPPRRQSQIKSAVAVPRKSRPGCLRGKRRKRRSPAQAARL